ncbi:MAG: hypothetical protein OXN16_01475 [Gammaproteobacteria bacterium]|nr:hypothetical protein [Gammaproteobacteria bacterium]
MSKYGPENQPGKDKFLDDIEEDESLSGGDSMHTPASHRLSSIIVERYKRDDESFEEARDRLEKERGIGPTFTKRQKIRRQIRLTETHTGGWSMQVIEDIDEHNKRVRKRMEEMGWTHQRKKKDT